MMKTNNRNEDQSIIEPEEYSGLCERFKEIIDHVSELNMQLEEEMNQRRDVIIDQSAKDVIRALIAPHDIDDTDEEQRQFIANRLCQIDEHLQQNPTALGEGFFTAFAFKPIMMLLRSKYKITDTRSDRTNTLNLLSDLCNTSMSFLPNDMGNKSLNEIMGEFLGGLSQVVEKVEQSDSDC